ncbi:competence protein ComEA [Legionella geestiana]|uniref:Competence protein ComEA n=1 Tax=Legionella geestiana TaxID=45065 RepID=A0A0W0TSD5_9GAMM|nr:helix-hairpin-helix domain-containing protein [Legionella geestiana]KTC98505.1 competence protein ComEA [Legionella geestiana]QBS13091.1 helix-hairpin-helix domain-containing protein [Legionella geestiana]QDQ39230.1 helix-hairpin-helix domain-containing protein [Legionella geestiana]STX54394.1 competence protein ComEA [Legionella geestiana]
MNTKRFALAVAFVCVSSAALAASEKIDLNRADAAALSHAVKGIGAKRAEAIILYREAHHGFKNLEELAEVKGIGKAFVKSHHAELEAALTVGKSG